MLPWVPMCHMSLETERTGLLGLWLRGKPAARETGSAPTQHPSCFSPVERGAKVWMLNGHKRGFEWVKTRSVHLRAPVKGLGNPGPSGSHRPGGSSWMQAPDCHEPLCP